MTIYSRSNLTAVDCTGKNPPILHNVHFVEGMTVAFDGKVLLVISPVEESRKKDIPLKEGETGPMTLSAETIREVLKNMPPDKQFGGLLEHADLSAEGTFKLTDGKRSRSISGKIYKKDFIDYKGVLRKARAAKVAVRVVLNRKRLRNLLDVIDKACPDSSGEAPVFLEFTDENDIFVRAVHPINGQRALGYMTSYKLDEGKWLWPDDWESKLTNQKLWFYHENSDGLVDLTYEEWAGSPESWALHELGPVLKGGPEEGRALFEAWKAKQRRPVAARPKAAVRKGT